MSTSGRSDHVHDQSSQPARRWFGVGERSLDKYDSAVSSPRQIPSWQRLDHHGVSFLRRLFHEILPRRIVVSSLDALLEELESTDSSD